MARKPVFAARVDRADMKTFPKEVRRDTPGQAQVEVTFLRTTLFECYGRKKGPKFYRGKTYVFDADFAQRWVKRNKAYLTEEGPPLPEENEKQAFRLGKGADLLEDESGGGDDDDALNEGEG